MSERKWHPVIGSAGFKPGIGRFERGEVVIMICALGFGFLVFRFLSTGFPNWLGLMVASVFPVGAGIFLLCFVTGKPRHYAADMVAWRWMNLACWLSNRGIPVDVKPLIEIQSNDRKIS